MIFAPFFRFILRIKPIGIETVPEEGGLVLCSNHIAALDVIAIGAACPRQLTFVAKKELFSVPLLGKVVKALGAIKVDRGANDVSAIKLSVEAAKNGAVLSIFPQGHRYPGVNPATTPIRHGAALIAYHSKCDVIPVCINVKNGKYAFLRKIEVIFGKPIKYSALGFENGGRDEYGKAAQKIFDNVLSLADYSYLPDYNEGKPRKKH